MRTQILAFILMQQLGAQICPKEDVAENQKDRCGDVFTGKRRCQQLGCCWDSNLVDLSCYLVVPSALTTTEDSTTTTSTTTTTTTATTTTTTTTSTTTTTTAEPTPSETAAALKEANSSAPKYALAGGIVALIIISAFGVIFYRKQKEDKKFDSFKAKTLARPTEELGKHRYFVEEIPSQNPQGYLPRNNYYEDYDFQYNQAYSGYHDGYNHDQYHNGPYHGNSPYQDTYAQEVYQEPFYLQPQPTTYEDTVYEEKPNSSMYDKERPLMPENASVFEQNQNFIAYDKELPLIPDSAAAYIYGSRIGFREPHVCLTKNQSDEEESRAYPAKNQSNAGFVPSPIVNVAETLIPPARNKFKEKGYESSPSRSAEAPIASTIDNIEFTSNDDRATGECMRGDHVPVVDSEVSAFARNVIDEIFNLEDANGKSEDNIDWK